MVVREPSVYRTRPLTTWPPNCKGGRVVPDAQRKLKLGCAYDFDAFTAMQLLATEDAQTANNIRQLARNERWQSRVCVRTSSQFSSSLITMVDVTPPLLKHIACVTAAALMARRQVGHLRALADGWAMI